MEGLLTNYYEYHFLYITGIHHVESKNIQGMALMKLFFHPGTNMAQAMAETVGYVDPGAGLHAAGHGGAVRACGSTPAACRSATWCCPARPRAIGEIQDQALFKVRPMFASLPGVSAPPPFGGNQRTIVVRVDPDRLRAYSMSPDDVVRALETGNLISPSGNVRIDDQMPIVPVNAHGQAIPRNWEHPDPAGRTRPSISATWRTVRGRHRHPDRLRSGQRPPGRLHPGDQAGRRLDAGGGQRRASKLCPKHAGGAARRHQGQLRVRPVALRHRGPCGAWRQRRRSRRRPDRPDGAAVPARLAERDRRRAQHPASRSAARSSALWLTGQTLNLMTLGGLALAVGILVDEATVEVENIHHADGAHADRSPGRCGRATQQTAVPRLLAMLCVLAVFMPSFFMQGAARELFVPLSLAVGFAMVDILHAVQHVRAGAVGLAAATTITSPPTVNRRPLRRGQAMLRPRRGGNHRLALAGRAGVPGPRVPR